MSTDTNDADETNGTIAVLAGPDRKGLGDALEDEGVTVRRLDGVVSRPALEEAGIVEADLYVLTEMAQATTIPIAKDLANGVRVVVYDDNSLPEFASAQTDLSIDPDLLGPEIVAEELVGDR
ncbi:CTP synthetase [Natrialbaceae archaeon GCM10025810]|uniref:DUF7126 family protein n=1 Tax=Halovalidus salilacus TaxID=3075124 RepID=UPI0036103240